MWQETWNINKENSKLEIRNRQKVEELEFRKFEFVSFDGLVEIEKSCHCEQSEAISPNLTYLIRLLRCPAKRGAPRNDRPRASYDFIMIFDLLLNI